MHGLMNVQICRGCSHDRFKFNYNCSYSFWENSRHYFCTSPYIIQTFPSML